MLAVTIPALKVQMSQIHNSYIYSFFLCASYRLQFWLISVNIFPKTGLIPSCFMHTCLHTPCMKKYDWVICVFCSLWRAVKCCGHHSQSMLNWECGIGACVLTNELYFHCDFNLNIYNTQNNTVDMQKFDIAIKALFLIHILLYLLGIGY